jgi:tRNA threonylcarbamoyladenosine biosynthesis protein TsaB
MGLILNGAAHATPPAGPLLAIDSSSAQGSIALFDGQTLSARTWPADQSHSTTLLAEIHHLLDAAAIELRDLVAVGIARGPGAFTGLRVGFGVAKGFHLATGVPLIAVSTLEATALPMAACGQPIVATVGAGRGRLVWAQYRVAQECLIETMAPRNGTIDELATDISPHPRAIVVGELDDVQAQVLIGIGTITVPPRALRARQPAAVAELAWRRWRAGDVDDAARVEPVYLAR